MVLYREGKEEWLPFDHTRYCSTASFDAASSVLEEIATLLQSLNITVEQVKRKLLLFQPFPRGVNSIYCIRI